MDFSLVLTMCAMHREAMKCETSISPTQWSLAQPLTVRSKARRNRICNAYLRICASRCRRIARYPPSALAVPELASMPASSPIRRVAWIVIHLTTGHNNCKPKRMSGRSGCVNLEDFNSSRKGRRLQRRRRVSESRKANTAFQLDDFRNSVDRGATMNFGSRLNFLLPREFFDSLNLEFVDPYLPGFFANCLT